MQSLKLRVKMIGKLQKKFLKEIRSWAKGAVKSYKSTLDFMEMFLNFIRDGMILSRNHCYEKDGQLEPTTDLATITAALNELKGWRECIGFDDGDFPLKHIFDDTENLTEDEKKKKEKETTEKQEKHWVNFWTLVSSCIRDWESVGL